MSNNESAWQTHPDYKIEITLINKPVSIIIDGEIIADSNSVLVLSEQDHKPVFYFPPQDIQMALLHQTTKETFCPFKGYAKHWSLKLENTQINIAAWSYEDPFEQVIEIKNYIGFYPDVSKHINLN